jgi:DNA adenine methylase Dam
MKYFDTFENWLLENSLLEEPLFEKNRSILRYYGSKFSMIDTLKRYFPKKGVNHFLDLFTGAANVAINVQYPRKTANDINKDMIDLYKHIQKTSYDKLVEEIETIVTEYGLDEVNQAGYYQLREDHFKDRDPMKLYVLTNLSYYGIMRFNSKGGFNKGYSHAPFNEKLAFSKLQIFKKDIKNIKFVSNHFSKLKPNKRTFVYADPPYLITKADYNMHWSKKDEIRLLKYLDELNAKGIKFALSNVITHAGRENTLLKKWSKKYKVIKLDKKYSLAKSEVQNTQEVLIVNYNI